MNLMKHGIRTFILQNSSYQFLFWVNSWIYFFKQKYSIPFFNSFIKYSNCYNCFLEDCSLLAVFEIKVTVIHCSCFTFMTFDSCFLKVYMFCASAIMECQRICKNGFFRTTDTDISKCARYPKNAFLVNLKQ